MSLLQDLEAFSLRSTVACGDLESEVSDERDRVHPRSSVTSNGAAEGEPSGVDIHSLPGDRASFLG
jgi:hypothetical protein